MRLALVTGEFPPMQGGVGDYTRQLAREFVRRGIGVMVITSLINDQRSVISQPPLAISYTRFASWRSLTHIATLTRDCDIVHIQYQAEAYGMTPPIHFLPRYLLWKNSGCKV